jgi:HD superfamily phosphohydrolase
MHKQVYFHKTRIAYDLHLLGAMQTILPNGQYPAPTIEGLEDYLKWDDWRVLTQLADGGGGDDGQRLLTRNHYRLVYQTRENVESVEDIETSDRELTAVKTALGSLIAETKTYSNNWYKQDSVDIPVQDEQNAADVRPLSEYSSLLRKFVARDQQLIYVKPEDVDEAKKLVLEVRGKDHNPQAKLDFGGQKKKEVASA